MSQKELEEQEQVILQLLPVLMPPTHSYASCRLDKAFIEEHKEEELYSNTKLITRICDISLLDYVLIHICREYGYENRFIMSDNTIVNMNTTKLINKVYQVGRTLDGRKYAFADATKIDDVSTLIRKHRLTEIINDL